MASIRLDEGFGAQEIALCIGLRVWGSFKGIYKGSFTGIF